MFPHWSGLQWNQNRMLFSALKKRLARMEDALGLREMNSLQGILARAARLTPEERRARITDLEDQLLAASGMEPTLVNRVQAINQVLLKHGIAFHVVTRLYGQEPLESQLKDLSTDR